MIKYIKDYENTGGTNQYIKMQEELQEANNEFIAGDIEKERQELWDLLQTVFTRFNQMGLRIEDIVEDSKLHYEKETLRGRVVVDIEGQGYKDKVIDELLLKIASLEKGLMETYNFNGNTEVLKELGIEFNVKPMEEDKDRKARYKI